MEPHSTECAESDEEPPSADSPGQSLSTGETQLVASRRQIMQLAVSVEGGLILLAIGLAWLFDTDLIAGIRLQPLSFAIGLAASLPMFAVLPLTARSEIPLLARIREVMDEHLLPWLSPCRLVDLAVLASLAGIAEELLFRAFLQAAIGEWLGPIWGLGIASAVFGVVHWITPGYALLACLAGFYLGGVWLATGGDTLAVMLAHGIYDFGALLILLRWHQEGLLRSHHEAQDTSNSDANPNPSE